MGVQNIVSFHLVCYRITKLIKILLCRIFFPKQEVLKGCHCTGYVLGKGILAGFCHLWSWEAAWPVMRKCQLSLIFMCQGHPNPLPLLWKRRVIFLGVAGKYVIGTTWSNLKGHWARCTVGNLLKINLSPSRDMSSLMLKERSLQFSLICSMFAV